MPLPHTDCFQPVDLVGAPSLPGGLAQAEDKGSSAAAATHQRNPGGNNLPHTPCLLLLISSLGEMVHWQMGLSGS